MMHDDTHAHDSAPEGGADWADAEGVEAPVVLIADESEAVRAVLPARRKTPAVPRKTEERESGGLRIESKIFSSRAVEEEEPSASGLEVAELGRAVVRLGSAEPAPVANPRVTAVAPTHQPKGEKPAPHERVSEEWGDKATKSWKWMIWGSGAAAVVVVVSLILQAKLGGGQESTRTSMIETLRVVDDTPKADDPVKEFTDRNDEVVDGMREALTKYATAKTPEEAVPWIRNGEALKPLLAEHWKAWDVPAGWIPEENPVLAFSSVGKRAFSMMMGSMPDFSTYRVFFVQEDGRMKVDWEATTGFNDRTNAELADRSVKDATIRATVGPVSFYTPAYPEDRYRSFRLFLADGVSAVWGYVEKGSRDENLIAREVDSGVILGRGQSEQLFRLKLVRGEEGALPSQWKIAGVLHKNWLEP